MKDELLISYAADFVSFLIARPLNIYKKMNKIVLFGSVARGEASEKSDVDIFIDTDDEKSIEKEVEATKKDFYESVKFKKYWKFLGVENDIRCVVGKLEQWRDLERSILSDGIVLYGKYSRSIESVRLITIFGWGSIKPESKRVLFNKRMFGYSQKGKFYSGILQKSGGQKLENAVIIPAEKANGVLRLFRGMKINVEMRNVNEY